MPEQTETRRVEDIIDAELGSLAFTALHISEVQSDAYNLADALTDDDRVPVEFVELLRQVAGYEVRL